MVSEGAGPRAQPSSSKGVLALRSALPKLQRMENYGQFCPVAQAAEIVTRRWMPLVIRELLCGSHRFNDLHRGVPRMSRALLVRRLSELELAGVIERRLADGHDHAEYHLTQAGEELRPIIFQLGFWGKRWVHHEVSRDRLDAGLLMWDMQRCIQRDRLPLHRVVVHFEFADAPRGNQHYWLVLMPGEVDLCLKDPGGDSDLVVCASTRSLTEVWLGDLPFAHALRTDAVRLHGRRELQRLLPEWLGLSVFAGEKRRSLSGSATDRDEQATHGA